MQQHGPLLVGHGFRAGLCALREVEDLPKDAKKEVVDEDSNPRTSTYRDTPISGDSDVLFYASLITRGMLPRYRLRMC